MPPPPWYEPSPRRCRLILILVLAGLGMFRLFYLQSLPLSEDEAYYWQWSRHLDWGYYDQGPLVAWLIRLSTMLLGTSELGVRLPALIMSLAMSLLLYDFCRRVLKDEWVGLWTMLAANTTLLFSAGAIIHTYDTAQGLFWAATIYFAGLALFQGRAGAWYGAGAATGLALLAKYSSALLPILILLFLAGSKKHRYWLSRRQPWLAALLAGLIFLPNLIWNAQHQWVTVIFNLGRTGGEWKFTLFDFLGAQALLMGPVGFVLLLWGLALTWRQARQGRERPAFLFWTSAPVLLLFMLLSLKTRVQGNWPAPAYLAALPATLLVLKGRILSSPAWRRWAAAAFISGLLLTALGHAHVPLFRALDLPAKLDPTKKLYGWPQLGREISQVLEQWPGEEKPFIFGLNYQMAGLAAYYTPGRPQTHCLFMPGGKLNAFLFWDDPAELKGREGLGIVYGRPPLEKLFSRADLIKTVALTGPTGKVIHRITLYYCKGFYGRDFRPPELGPS